MGFNSPQQSATELTAARMATNISPLVGVELEGEGGLSHCVSVISSRGGARAELPAGRTGYGYGYELP